jgi:uroporphyrinogen III methyltransferase/synthase
VTIAVTRAREQASRLAERLRGLGAAVVVAPVIRTETLAGPVPELDAYDLICFTSPTGVEALFERLQAAGLDTRAFPNRTETRIAAIGPATARALRRHGIETDLMPTEAVGEALAEVLKDVPVTRALVPRAREARDVVPEALQARGAEVDVVPVYETVVELLDDEQTAAVAAADYITFTSASTVRNFFASVGGPEAWLARGSSRPRTVSIGPVTSDELRSHGLTPDIEADDHDIDGLVAAIVGA